MTPEQIEELRRQLDSARDQYRVECEQFDRMKARAEKAEAEVERLKDVLHLDRSGLAHALNQIRKSVNGWAWIQAGEWGSYEYQDQTVETLQKEVGNLINEANEIAHNALQVSGNLAHAECCGREKRKHPLEARISDLESELAASRAKEVADITLPGGKVAKFVTPETRARIAELEADNAKLQADLKQTLKERRDYCDEWNKALADARQLREALRKADHCLEAENYKEESDVRRGIAAALAGKEGA